MFFGDYMLIDTHCHLEKQYYENMDEVIQRMPGIMITAGCDRDSNKEVLEIINKNKSIYGVIGIHPEFVDNYQEEDLKWIEEHIQDSKIVGIGEVGLDYYWDESPRDVQQDVFRRQIEVAHELKMPVDIHTRDAFEDCYKILKESNLEYGAILHSFNGSAEWLNKFLDLNVYFSYSGVVSFTKAKEVHGSAKNAPLDRILVETDAPYLTPKPYRGKQNEPAYVRYVAQAIADLKEIPLEEVADATYANTVRVYGLE